MKKNVKRIEVAQAIWKWISSIKEVQQLEGEARTKFEKWRDGDVLPTFNQLEKFSKAAHIPIGYFFLNNPPEENFEILNFRTVKSAAVTNPSRNLIDIIYQMETLQEWMRDYLISINAEKLSIVGRLSEKTPISAAAETIRKILSLDLKWYEESTDATDSFNMLREKMGLVGVSIMIKGYAKAATNRSLDINEFRAFTLIDDYAPLIFINGKDTKNGRLFSLLHEFAHIVLGVNNFFNKLPSPKKEGWCNKITAEILAPETEFRNKWKECNENPINRVEKLSKHFCCSQVVIARRAFDCEFISFGEYNEINEKAKMKAEENREKGGGGDYYKTLISQFGKKLLLALDASLKSGQTLYTDAYSMTNTNINTFEKLIERVRNN